VQPKFRFVPLLLGKQALGTGFPKLPNRASWDATPRGWSFSCCFLLVAYKTADCFSFFNGLDNASDMDSDVSDDTEELDGELTQLAPGMIMERYMYVLSWFGKII
jgi:hypothetical protein